MSTFIPPSDTVLRRATLAQTNITWKNTYEQWGKPAALTLNTYTERETKLAKTPFSLNGLTTWVLVPRSDPDTLDFIFAHCETYRRPALFTVPSTADACNDVDDTEKKAVSIASVFSPSRYRGKGYAPRMLSLLREELNAAKDVAFSVLYSDIGPTYYAKKGWQVRPSRQLVISATSTTTTVASVLRRNLDEPALVFESLRREDVGRVAAVDCASLRETWSVPASSSRLTALVLPTAETYDWHFSRVSEHSFPVGAYSDGGGQRDPAFAIWTVDVAEDRLQILRLKYRTSRELLALLESAVDTAVKAKVARVVAWISPEVEDISKHLPIVAAETEVDSDSTVRIVTRKSSLPSVAVHTNVESASIENVDWVCCEKFGWV